VLSAVLNYLSRYVFRTARSAMHAFFESTRKHLWFRWKDCGADGRRTERLRVVAFLRRFSQHFLP
jgi:hypothetical protein